MGLFICDVCNFHCGIGANLVNTNVKKEDIDKYHNYLIDEKRKAELLADNIEDKVLLLLSKYPKEILDGRKTIEIDAQLLRDLWYNLELRHYDERTPEEFCSNWLATHFVLCEANDLFNKKFRGKTIMERLTVLYKACVSANELMDYGDEDRLMSPEDVAKELSKFVKPNWFWRCLGYE